MPERLVRQVVVLLLVMLVLPTAASYVIKAVDSLEPSLIGHIDLGVATADAFLLVLLSLFSLGLIARFVRTRRRTDPRYSPAQEQRVRQAPRPIAPDVPVHNPAPLPRDPDPPLEP